MLNAPRRHSTTTPPLSIKKKLPSSSKNHPPHTTFVWCAFPYSSSAATASSSSYLTATPALSTTSQIAIAKLIIFHHSLFPTLIRTLKCDPCVDLSRLVFV